MKPYNYFFKYVIDSEEKANIEVKVEYHPSKKESPQNCIDSCMSNYNSSTIKE